MVVLARASTADALRAMMCACWRQPPSARPSPLHHPERRSRGRRRALLTQLGLEKGNEICWGESPQQVWRNLPAKVLLSQLPDLFVGEGVQACTCSTHPPARALRQRGAVRERPSERWYATRDEALFRRVALAQEHVGWRGRVAATLDRAIANNAPKQRRLASVGGTIRASCRLS